MEKATSNSRGRPAGLDELIAATASTEVYAWHIVLNREGVQASTNLGRETWTISHSPKNTAAGEWQVAVGGVMLGGAESALDAVLMILVKHREELDRARDKVGAALADVSMMITEMMDAQPAALPAAPAARREPQGVKKSKPPRETPRIEPAPEMEPDQAHASELEQLEWLIDEARLPMEDQGALLAEIRRGYQVTELTSLSLEQLRQLTAWLSRYPAGEHRAVAVRQRLAGKK